MFIVEDSDNDISNKVRIRTFNFGSDDLEERGFNFIWEENTEFFLSVVEDEINDFIQDCYIEDRNQTEPDIKYLNEINYPSAKELFNSHPEYFLRLISDYPDLVTHPFFSNPYINGDSLTSGFAMSTLDSMAIKENTITFSGKGFYFPKKLESN